MVGGKQEGTKRGTCDVRDNTIQKPLSGDRFIWESSAFFGLPTLARDHVGAAHPIFNVIRAVGP